MQIKADREGAVAIKHLCDAALRIGGMDNYPGVTKVLANLSHPDTPKPEPEPEKPDAPDEDKKE